MKLVALDDLIIIGAGGIGVQVADAVDEINKKGSRWNLRGFLDDDEKKRGLDICGYPVLGKIDDAGIFDDCFFLLAVGNSTNYYVKKKVFKKLAVDRQRFATVVHPDATVSRHASLGFGTAVLAGARVMAETTVGDHVAILCNSYIGHNDNIGDFVTVTNSASVAGFTKIEEGCYIGMNSSIIERVRIGKWSLVGMGSMVLRDLPPFSVVVGNPGRIIKTQDPSIFDV